MTILAIALGLIALAGLATAYGLWTYSASKDFNPDAKRNPADDGAFDYGDEPL
jgi:hypothetical protein